MQKESMTKDVIILGGPGDGIGVASFIEDLIRLKKEKIKLLGFLNDFTKGEVYGYPILGKLNDASSFSQRDNVFFVSAILKVKQSYQRSKLLESLNIPLSKFITIIHPTATIARSTQIGLGTVIGPYVNIMPNVIIGNHCSLRASANIEHDSTLEDFCYVGPNATLAGKTKMKTGAHVGPNACVLEFKTIGSYSVVGMGSSVVKDVNEFNVVVGCPARKVGKTFK